MKKLKRMILTAAGVAMCASAMAQSVVIVAFYPRTNGTPARVLIGAEQLASNICNIQQATDMTALNWFTGAVYGCYPEHQWVLGSFNTEFYTTLFFRSKNEPCSFMPLIAQPTYPLDAEEKAIRWTYAGRTWMLNKRLESSYSTRFPFEELRNYTGVELPGN